MGKMPDKRLWATYKMPLKDYIFATTNDAVYRANKIKVASVRNSWGYELGIDENWNVITFGKYSISTRRLSEKYGTRLTNFLDSRAIAAREQRERMGGDSLLLGCTALALGAGFLTLAAFACVEAADPYGASVGSAGAHVVGAPDDPHQAYGGGGGGCGGGGE
eukprot:NODE_4078_length_713_cov_190.299392.p2 GENE.NODE_4078_length_713_cov_190.299392~~NODE_4078_length_713_cov_190.299392.p2  ORF type:complete len:163 (+),score=50.50 NODE_4078_length_713_cov_190.299392:3-491(+)